LRSTRKYALIVKHRRLIMKRHIQTKRDNRYIWLVVVVTLVLFTILQFVLAAKIVDDTISGASVEVHVLNGLPHREDGPAIEYSAGSQYWYSNGKLHREDGPAVTWEGGGTKMWYLNGVKHRVDGPAVIWADGTNEWWKNGIRHEWWENGIRLGHWLIMP